MAVNIRPATYEDIPQIHSIYEYYVLKTVVTFLVNPPPLTYISERFKSTEERGLPYLVAVDKSPTESGDEPIVGYAYASGFRGFMLGYAHTVEITIFLHPDHRGRGVGNKLMEQLLQQLRGKVHISRESSGNGQLPEPLKVEVKQVLAIMSVDEEGPGGGMALRDWYRKWGFEEVGHLRKVGHKKGRWYAGLIPG